MVFLSPDHAVLFKARCLCKCPLVAVHLNSVFSVHKSRKESSDRTDERALKQERLKKPIQEYIPDCLDEYFGAISRGKKN